MENFYPHQKDCSPDMKPRGNRMALMQNFPFMIDSHCHLDYLENEGNDIGKIINDAKEGGVKYFITIGTKWHLAHEQISLATRFDNIYCTLGIHPHEAKDKPTPSLEEMLTSLIHPKVIGIGETGLDYFYNHSPKEEQRACFLLQIKAAQISGLPLVIHCRDADEEVIDILKVEQAREKFKGLIHCFSGTESLARAAVDLDMFISLSGIITFPKAEDLREIVKNVPMESLLIETDSPFLAPIPKRGKPNQPAFVVHTAQKLADIKQISLEQAIHQTTQNCQRIFHKANFN